MDTKKLNSPDMIIELMKKFGEDVINKLIDKLEELEQNGDFIVIDKDQNYLFRGSQTKCMDYWMELDDLDNTNVCEVEYDIVLNLDTGYYKIPDQLKIIRVLI